MDARQQVALAPFVLGRAGREAPAHHEALLLQRQQGEVDIAALHRQRSGNRGRGGHRHAAEPAAHQFTQRVLARPCDRIAGRRLDRSLQCRLRMHRQQLRQALGGRPQAIATDLQARRTAMLRQLSEQRHPARCLGFAVARGTKLHQCLVHLVGIARLRPGILARAIDRAGIEPSEVLRPRRIAQATRLHRAGAALLQRRIVEEGIRPRAQYFRRERRRPGQVAGDDLHLAGFQRAQQGQPAIDIHRLVQAIVKGLRDQRMVRHFAFADDVLQASHLVREHGGHQVLGLHPLQLRRDLPAADEARQRQRGGCVPAETRGEQRRVQQCLHQHLFGAGRMQVAHHLDQRERMAGRERQHDRVLGRRRLQFEIELAAEALAQRQSPGLVDAAAVRRMDHQLGAAGFVEEAFQREMRLRRQHAEAGELCCGVFGDLLRGGFIELQLRAQPMLERRLAARLQLRLHRLAQPRHAGRQFDAAARRLAQPERDAGRHAFGILHAHAPGLDAQDPVTRIAELEHVAGDALDGEVFVDGADDDRLRLQQHGVVADIGDGAAGLDRGQARALAPAQLAMHGVAMQVARALAVAGAEAIGQHPHHLVEILSRQTRVRPGAMHHLEQRILVPFDAGDFGDELLRQHVQRRRRHDQRVQLAAPHAIQQRHAFQQFVARRRKQPPLRHTADLVAGAADALQERGDAAWRADLADQVDVADVDAEFQRGGGDEHLELAALELLLGIQPQLLGQRTVVRGHVLLAQQFAEVAGGALGHAPGVDEHEGGRMPLDQFGDARMDQLPLRVRHHRLQRHRRQLQREVAGARMADVDDGAGKTGVRGEFLLVGTEARIWFRQETRL